MKEDRSRVELSAHQAPGIRDIVESSTSTGTSERLSAELLKKISATLKLQNPLGTIYVADKSVKLAPLFLIHDGSGICLSYHRIQPFGRTIYAVHDPKFLESDSWPGIPAMAQAYAKLIKATNSGPLILGGWSFGGVVAFEAARVLQAEGHAIAGVVLIDSPPPINHKPLSAAIINDVVRGAERVNWSVTLFAVLLGKVSHPARGCWNFSNQKLPQAPVDRRHELFAPFNKQL